MFKHVILFMDNIQVQLADTTIFSATLFQSLYLLLKLNYQSEKFNNIKTMCPLVYGIISYYRVPFLNNKHKLQLLFVIFMK